MTKAQLLARIATLEDTIETMDASITLIEQRWLRMQEHYAQEVGREITHCDLFICEEDDLHYGAGRLPRIWSTEQ